MSYPARISFVPPQVSWINPEDGRPTPMFARYLSYVDQLLVALVAAGGVTTPQRVTIVTGQVSLADPTGLATYFFARWIAYLESVLTILTNRAIFLGFVVPVGGNAIPPNLTIFNMETGKPTDNFQQYILFVDMTLQALVAAGV